MRLIVALILILGAGPVLAAPTPDIPSDFPQDFSWTPRQGRVCWQTELDPYTNQPYSSQNAYDADLASWRSNEPPMGSLIKLAKAYRIYRSERENSLGLGSDKRAHCYMGCRIAQGTTLVAATYAAWKKELGDLTDCGIGSRFEPADFHVTVFGAHAGLSLPNSQQACREFCIANVAPL